MEEIDELRPLPALRLLEIWRANQEVEPLERALLCNAQVLAESCLCRGEPVFRDRDAVLAALTTREMETLLQHLGSGERPEFTSVNPRFQSERFAALRGE